MALSGDYDFQFMAEELAVGAQHKLPYLHIVVNNSGIARPTPFLDIDDAAWSDVLDTNLNGEFDEDEPSTRTSRDNPNTARDERGSYRFEGLAPGADHVLHRV